MIDDPLAMSEEERFREVAAILAAGVLRLQRIALPTESQKMPESSDYRLESVADRSVTVHPG